MENTPLTNEVSAIKKESRKSKSRKLETIGSLAVKPESAEQPGRGQLSESSWLRSIQRAPEQIGHMLVSITEPEQKAGRRKTETEMSHTGRAATEKSAAESFPQPAPGKRIDTLSRAELLSLSETIMIDGSSLHQIYETHLIGEQGLRRLVAEHVRGGDMKKALHREIVEREIDFERDPALRDMVPQGPVDVSKAELNKLLEQAMVSVSDSGEEAAFFKARARYEARQLQQHKKQRRAVDFSVAISIMGLIALVIILYLSRN